MDLQDFRRAVDATQDQLSPIRDDFNAIYQIIGLPQRGSYTVHAVVERLYDLIREAVGDEWQAERAKYIKIRRELIISHHLDGVPFEPYFTALSSLIDAIRAPAANAATKPKSGDAIQHAVNCRSVSSLHYTDEFRKEIHRKDYAVAEAALRLRARSYDLQRHFGDIFLNQQSEAALVDRLERTVRKIGGANLAKFLFEFLTPTYNADQERYQLVRATGMKESQLPIGYLLQLCAKYPIGTVKDIDQGDLKDVLRLSTDYAALHEVQTYSQFELMFVDSQGLLPFLRELAIHDVLFCAVQMRPSDVVRIIRGIVGSTQRKMPGGYTVEDILEVTASILQRAKRRRGPLLVRTDTLKKALPHISAKAIKVILDDVLCHAKGANQRFSKPTDAPDQNLPREQRRGPDFADKPLLRTRDPRNYLLMDAALCAPSFLEAVFTVLRAAEGTSFDNGVGPAIEEFLRRELLAHGIPTISGKYNQGTVEEGECDLVIQTADTIVLIETKKKSLTRLARAGYDVNLLLDLSASMLDAQLQAGAHELRLLTDGHLDLVQNDGSTVRLEAGGRHIERIAMTLLDYGSFQDRILLSRFLEIVRRASYGAADPQHKPKFDKLNQKLRDLDAQTRALLVARSDNSANPQPFFNCWFLSVPQMLVLLDNVGSPDDFKSALWSTRHFGSGSMDFYFDHAYMRALPEMAAMQAKKTGMAPSDLSH